MPAHQFSHEVSKGTDLPRTLPAVREGRSLELRISLALLLGAALLPATALGSGREVRASGWLDVSYTASSARTTNRPLGFNDQVDSAMLQQNWLRLELPVAGDRPSTGLRLDAILPGTDYRFVRARGLLDRQTARTGVDPVQFYLERAWPGSGLDLKLGRFYSPFGVESIEATANALFSHSYTALYDASTHTGALLTRTAGELTYSAGVVAGCDSFIDESNQATLFASARWSEPTTSRGDSVQVSTILGNSEYDTAHEFNNPNLVDLVWLHPLTSRLTLTLDGLMGWQAGVPGLGDANWTGVSSYLTYDWTTDLHPTLRLEAFDDAQGSRTGFSGRYTAATLGVSCKLGDRLTFRPEVRYDSNDTSKPWNGRSHLETVAADLIWRW